MVKLKMHMENLGRSSFWAGARLFMETCLVFLGLGAGFSKNRRFESSITEYNG